MRAVECTQCKHVFEVDEATAAELVPCPSCRSMVPLLSGAGAGLRPKLALKKDEAVSGQLKRCPLCDASAPADAAICLTCGYDWRTGQQVRLPRLGGRVKWVRAAAATALVAAAAVGVRVYLERRGAQQVPAPAEVVGPSAPAAPPAPTAPAAAGPQAPAPAPVPATGVAEEEKPEGSASAADLRLAIVRRLDAQAPLYEAGAIVALRKSNGMVLRGTFLGAQDGVVRLQQEAEILEIPVRELDLPNRIRCDAKYREKYVDFLVARRSQAPAVSRGPNGR